MNTIVDIFDNFSKKICSAALERIGKGSNHSPIFIAVYALLWEFYTFPLLETVEGVRGNLPKICSIGP